MRAAHVDATVASFRELPLMLTVEETARVLRIGRNGAYEAIASGAIPSIRIGRKIRVPRKALAAWIDDADEERRVDPSTDGAVPTGTEAPQPPGGPFMDEAHRVAE